MTEEEIDILKKYEFVDLWKYLWKMNTNDENTNTYDYINSHKKFKIIKNDNSMNLDALISNRTANYKDQEWGFPKGRKNRRETNIETAVREFTEETGIPEENIKIINKKFIENYISYDNLEYKNIYFLAKYTGDENIFTVSDINREQFAEVSEIKFLDTDDAYNIIRNYSKKKRKIVKLVKIYINKYL